ncbi:hypothetical protein SPFM1_00075 [Salmonella phage SPFM1]|nr:hypothetical protein SPFM1_00075 [Salmonella phage SPFM1]
MCRPEKYYIRYFLIYIGKEYIPSRTEINRIKEPEGRYYIVKIDFPMGKRPVSVILTRGIVDDKGKPIKEYYRSVDKSITLRDVLHQEKGYVLNDITDLLFRPPLLSYRALDIRDELATTYFSGEDSNVWFFEDLAISRMLVKRKKFVDVAGDGLPADKMPWKDTPKMRQYDPIGVVNNELFTKQPWDNIYTIVNNHAALENKDDLVFIGKMIPDAHFSVNPTVKVKDETFYYMFGGNHAIAAYPPICTVKYCYPLVNEDRSKDELPASAEPEPIAAGMNLARKGSAITATNDGVPYQPYFKVIKIKGHSGHYGNDRADE